MEMFGKTGVEFQEGGVSDHSPEIISSFFLISFKVLVKNHLSSLVIGLKTKDSYLGWKRGGI
jgi:hypothetical protein